MLVYVDPLLEDPAGPASADFCLRDLVLGWLADYDFQSSGPADADLVIVQGTMSSDVCAQCFLDVADWVPFRGLVGARARRIYVALTTIINSNVGKGYADVHFYTYQQ